MTHPRHTSYHEGRLIVPFKKGNVVHHMYAAAHECIGLQLAQLQHVRRTHTLAYIAHRRQVGILVSVGVTCCECVCMCVWVCGCCSVL